MTSIQLEASYCQFFYQNKKLDLGRLIDLFYYIKVIKMLETMIYIEFYNKNRIITYFKLRLDDFKEMLKLGFKKTSKK